MNALVRSGCCSRTTPPPAAKRYENSFPSSSAATQIWTFGWRRHLVKHLVRGRPRCSKRDVDCRFRSMDELELLDPVGSPFVDTPIASEPIAGLLQCPQTFVPHLQRPWTLAANPRL